MEHVTELVDAFLASFLDNDELLSSIAVSSLVTCPGLDLSSINESGLPELKRIYGFLVDKWITSLPPDVSNVTRGSRFKIVRNIAVELYLSSISISLQIIDPVETAHPEDDTGQQIEGDETRGSSPATFYSSRMSEIAEGSPGPAPSTPTRHSSVFSQSQETLTSDVIEDPAITRLRQYAPSIRDRPELGKSRLLSEWPSAPGVDPSTYSYKPPVLDDSDEKSHQIKREIARRKKRTKKFLQRNRETASQASTTPFGSQPPDAVRPGFSSQPTQDVPMTQPDRGAFGSRHMAGKKNQQKKPRAAGFR